MYFVVLRLLKVIKNRYFLVMNFMVFRDPHFYRFLIDFGRPWGLQKSSLSVPVAFSKKKVLIQRLHLMRKGSKKFRPLPAGTLPEQTLARPGAEKASGSHFSRSWTDVDLEFHIDNFVQGFATMASGDSGKVILNWE